MPRWSYQLRTIPTINYCPTTPNSKRCSIPREHIRGSYLNHGSITVIRTYGLISDPNTLPDSVRICHSDFVTVKEYYYAKSVYHYYLVVPRLPPTLDADQPQDPDWAPPPPLPTDEVLNWPGPKLAPTWFATKVAMNKDEYLPLLKVNPRCPHCDAEFLSAHKLCQHLRVVFVQMKKDHRKRQEELARTSVASPAAVEADSPADEHAASEDGSRSSGADSGDRTDDGDTDQESAASTPVEAGHKRKHSECQDDTPFCFFLPVL
ncbi:hypothetical protein GY45DRAFT_1370250 [Cubamyces sp. BRFM 1775]|nr:hypothetical protein GY45DRAFT_1370250 [Cubamyces sp. BRFM 1775]